MLTGFASICAHHADFKQVTCGSAVKLQHKESGYRLHSHGINWGSGSGQQSVTAFEQYVNADPLVVYAPVLHRSLIVPRSVRGADPNSLWAIKEGYGIAKCVYGTPIKCNDVVRFVHVQTQRHLHSHLHQVRFFPYIPTVQLRVPSCSCSGCCVLCISRASVTSVEKG